MKRFILLFFILIIFSFFCHIPPYKELNNLMIITSININCKSDSYVVIFYETLPKKEDNGIVYHKKKYIKKGKNLLSIKNSFNNHNNKKVCYSFMKWITTNCTNKKEIVSLFPISFDNIYDY